MCCSRLFYAHIKKEFGTKYFYTLCTEFLLFLLYKFSHKLFIPARLSPEISLGEFQAQLSDFEPFLGTFYTFNTNLHIQIMNHGTKLIQKIIFLFICKCFRSERAVNLNNLWFQLTEIMEVRVSGSKVIQRQTDSHSLQFCEKMLLIYILFQKIALCQFHDHRYPRQPCPFH